MTVPGQGERTPLIRNGLVERGEIKYHAYHQRVAYGRSDVRRLEGQSSEQTEFSDGNNEQCLRVLKISGISCVIIIFGLLLFFLGRESKGSMPPTPVFPTPDEIEWYRNSGVYWDTPQRLDCLDRYNYREYSAQLQNVSHVPGFNILKACRAMHIEIRGQRFESPHFCKQSGSQMYGYWTVYDQLDCTIEDEKEKYRKSGMFWSKPLRLDCLERYHYRQYFAELQNIPNFEGFDIFKACKFIPVEIVNQTLVIPDTCTRSGDHVYGHWTVYDTNDCTIEDEKERYRKSGMFWGGPQPAEHCHSYDKREYVAQLFDIPRRYDWQKACLYMPISIQDQILEVPDSCDLEKSEHWPGTEVYGKWIVSAQLDCRPYWGPLKFVGCQASGKKRYEAELWNLIPGDDFYEMCYTTPANWHGQYYEHPSACDNREKRGGMIGIWDIESC